tara:strand:- start:276 stop:1019 length:744 start_codon:yes stop_codon:yes gene_type:complete
MKFFKLIFFFLSFLLSQTGYEIAQKISDQPTPGDVRAKLLMTLEDKRGNKMESTIKSYTKDDGKKQIMWFLSPPADRGISLYKIERDNDKDEMKMWLPAFKKVRKISSRRKSQNFMNSDLTFEDLYNRKIDDYTYEVEISKDSIYYILTSILDKDIESGYTKHVSWVDIQSLLVKKEESFGKSGILVKTKEFKFIKINGFDMVEEIYVVDSRTKHKTYLRFDDILLNSGINDSEFHEMNLRRIPINE